MDEAGAEHDNSPSGPCMLLFISDLRVSLPQPRTSRRMYAGLVIGRLAYALRTRTSDTFYHPGSTDQDVPKALISPA